MPWLLFLLWLPAVLGGSLSDVTALACRRNHSLPICQTLNQHHEKRPTTSQLALLSAEDLEHLEDIANAVSRIKRNPFSEIEEAADLEGGHGGEDLREKEIGDAAPLDDDDLTDISPKKTTAATPTEGFLLQEKTTDSEPEESSVSSSDTSTFKGETGEYCSKYEEHFSFYCVGEVDSNGENAENCWIAPTFPTNCFCSCQVLPSLQNGLSHQSERSHSNGHSIRLTHSRVRETRNSIQRTRPLTSWPSTPSESSPSDPFSKPVHVTKHRRILVEDDSSDSDEEDVIDKHEKQKAIYLNELKRRFPCKPDCDQRIFPHCTAECKCDWIYPTVQRFCNPPPMPFFLNTCRLWYWGCPKYERYHYASQFMYSKAEKGKVLPGQISNPNPYGIPSPLKQLAGTPSGSRTLDRPIPLSPIARSSPTLMVVPPELPANFRKRDDGDKTTINAMSTSEARSILHGVMTQQKQEQTPQPAEPKQPRRRKNSTRTTTKAKRQPTAREIYRTLSAINDLTKDPASLSRDPVSLVSPGLGGGGERARAHQVGNIPVVPSDAAIGAQQDPFSAFDGLTDSRGILHRPRSTSPFTKPGLWAANPDDPHNRDHANKWFYRPYSVGVDWLNGQLQWGAHWAVPAAGVGGTDGQSALHFPSIGNFLNIADDYD